MLAYSTIMIWISSFFEFYFLFRLISKGEIYPYRVRIDEKEKNKKKALAEKLLGILDEYKEEGKIEGFRRENESVFTLYVKVQTPIYQFMYKEYDPEIKYVDKLDTFKSLEAIPRPTNEIIEKHKNISYYNNFHGGIKRGLLINDIISPREWDRIKVHYNFLSIFTHFTHKCVNMIEHVSKHFISSFDEIREFDHCLSELIILYILRLIEYYLKVVLHHENESWKLSDTERIESYLAEVDREIHDFLFIFENAHPKKSRNYYKDPLRRLKEMHNLFPI